MQFYLFLKMDIFYSVHRQKMEISDSEPSQKMDISDSVHSQKVDISDSVSLQKWIFRTVCKGKKSSAIYFIFA